MRPQGDGPVSRHLPELVVHACLDSVFDAGRVGAAEPAGSGSRGGRWHGRDAQGGLHGEQPGLEGGAEERAG